jgi:hypothetical protein
MIYVASKVMSDLLQWVLAEMVYWLEVCHVTKGRHKEHLGRCAKRTWRVSLPICRSHLFLSAIQVYHFYEVCHRIMNNPVHHIPFISILPYLILYPQGHQLYANFIKHPSAKVSSICRCICSMDFT